MPTVKLICPASLYPTTHQPTTPAHAPPTRPANVAHRPAHHPTQMSYDSHTNCSSPCTKTWMIANHPRCIHIARRPPTNCSAIPTTQCAMICGCCAATGHQSAHRAWPGKFDNCMSKVAQSVHLPLITQSRPSRSDRSVHTHVCTRWTCTYMHTSQHMHMHAHHCTHIQRHAYMYIHTQMHTNKHAHTDVGHTGTYTQIHTIHTQMHTTKSPPTHRCGHT